MDEVSEARIRATIEKLVSFQTRNTLSNPDDPVHGVGAARQWIFQELQSYNPRLQVRFDKYRVKKQGQRIFRDVDLWNVIAVLPGKKDPDTQILVSAHYDTVNLGVSPAMRPPGLGTDPPAAGADGAAGGGGAGGGFGRGPQQTPEELERAANQPAPGACDDGSGIAAVRPHAGALMTSHRTSSTRPITKRSVVRPSGESPRRGRPQAAQECLLAQQP